LYRLNIITDIGVSSFYYATRYLISWIDPSRLIVTIHRTKYDKDAVNLYIGDMWNVFRHPLKADIYWIDTPMFYLLDYDRVPLQVYRPKNIWVTSTWNKRMAEKYFKDVKIVPRPIHPIYIAYTGNTKKEYDLAMIGDDNPKKSYDVFDMVCRQYGLRCWSTRSYTGLGLYQLVQKLSQTKFLLWVTRTEGYGFPLIEAQALGVPAICIQAHANINYCYSAKIDPNLWVRVKTTRTYYYLHNKHLFFEPDIQDVRRAVEYALGISMGYYYTISFKIMNRIRRLVLDTVEYVNKQLTIIAEEKH